MHKDAERRAELLRTIFAAVVVGPAGVVGFTLRPPFDVLLGPGRDGGEGRDTAQALLNTA